MTTAPTGGSPTLEALFKNCVTEEQIQQASVTNLRGPFHIGEVTAFVFRPAQENDRDMVMTVLEDTGLATGEGGSMEIDMNQLDPDDMRERAQNWYRTQVTRGHFGLHQKVAVVYDDTRTVANELRSTKSMEALKKTLDDVSSPRWTERALTALKRTFCP